MVNEHSVKELEASPIADEITTIVNQTTLIQRQAADPRASVWVSASAGTGKTKILTDRVLNLLLSGVAPRKILCLTYTKAAASEMNIRLLQRLSDWASYDSEQLGIALYQLLGYQPSNKLCDRAQLLFIDVLNTPGGLNIQTIHSFCQSILRLFPTEANIAPDFVIADTTLSQQLLQECLQNMFTAAESNPLLRGYLDKVTLTSGLTGLLDKLQSLLASPINLRALQHQGLDKAIQTLCQELGLTSLSDSAAMIVEFYQHLEISLLKNCCQSLQNGGKEDQTRAAMLAKTLTSIDSFKDNFGIYQKVFLTQDHEIRSRLASQKAQAKDSQLIETMENAAWQIQHFTLQLKAQSIAKQSKIWMTLGLWIYDAYSQLKRQKGILDYDDLLTYVFELLHQPGLAPFILYKLDGGIHHILIDEAQDTSPLQWALIAALTEEFFSGQGSIAHVSTLFAVGDFKQSIYSFQGAEPQLFHEMRLNFAHKVVTAAHDWHNLDMHVSFRSTPPILRFVDAVFAESRYAQGVADPSIQTIHHLSYNPQGSGVVELWPLVPCAQELDQSDQQHYVSPRSEERLAEVIARQIRKWLDQETILESKARLLTAGDILILVQRRNSFLYAMMRALKKQHIPVAGLDRLDIMEHIAVADMRALGQFLLLPDDDLALAAVFKSPLFGFDDDQLLIACQRRQKGQSLWRALRQSEDLSELETHAMQYLRALLRKADFITPFNLYADILFASGGLKKFITRMGPTVKEVLEEFLNMTQNYEASHGSSLQKFLQWCTGASSEIKRDLSTSALNEVRLMTVHGAKGLQAPVVIIADTTRVPDIQDAFIWSSQGYIVPNIAKNAEVPCVGHLKDNVRGRNDEEYRRLLYVALTRAEERLYICGWDTQRARGDDCWYNLCQQGLQKIGQACTYDFNAIYTHGWQGQGLSYQHIHSSISTFEKTNHHKQASQALMLLPDFLLQPAPFEKPLQRPHTASHSDDIYSLTPTTGPKTSADITVLTQSQLRGLYIHKLLEVLPSQPLTQWPHLAEYYARSYPTLIVDDSYYQSVCNLLQHADYQHLFGSNSWPEVAMMGTINNESYAVQIDRLVIEPTRIIIIDYKSNPNPPMRISEVPVAYIKQLNIYRQLVQNLYPDKKIITYLLWTATPQLMCVNQ